MLANICLQILDIILFALKFELTKYKSINRIQSRGNSTHSNKNNFVLLSNIRVHYLEMNETKMTGLNNSLTLGG